MIREKLNWTSSFDLFDEDEQKVLAALSNEKYDWRTKSALEKVTGFDGKQLDKTLSNLLKKEVVRPSFSSSKELLFGLKEIVG